MDKNNSDNVIIRSVENSRDLKEFINFPWKIYKEDKQWCPPLFSDCKKMFTGKHPFHKYGEMKLFLAEKQEEVVGRIASIKNTLHNKEHNDNTGFFGFFESIDDFHVAKALLDTASAWLKEQGFDKMTGPASPSSNYEYGCQYSGFEYPQVLLSTHNASYYFKLFEKYGLNKLIDLYAYKINKESSLLSHEKMSKTIAIIQKKNSHIRIRELDKKNKKAEIYRLLEIFNLAWKGNHGFIPFTTEEANDLYSSLRLIAEPNHVILAEINGQIVAGSIFLPDYNHFIRGMNGKLSLLNIFKILMLKKKITRGRHLILGMLPEYRRGGILHLLLNEFANRYYKDTHFKESEASYILENNHLMRGLCERLNGTIYKKYRVFEKEI